MKKRRKDKKIPVKKICVLLSFILLLPSIIVSAADMFSFKVHQTIADEIVIDSPRAKEPSPSVDPSALKKLNAGEKTLSELSKIPFDSDTLPSFIDKTLAAQKQHVNRLYEQEDGLSTIVYQNKNGTKTTYIFDQPVKYVDENGRTRDKSTKVTATDDPKVSYAYAMADNSVKVFFPTSLSSGTVLNFENYSAKLVPVGDMESNAVYQSDHETITYDGAFGANTSVSYQPLLNGVKEEIVLLKNIGKTEFQFDLYLTNLKPINEEGKWYLVNHEGARIATFGTVTFRSAGNKISATGEMTIISGRAANVYTVTITLPEFLNTTSSMYPVYIHQSFNIYEDSSYSGFDENGNEIYVEYSAITDTGLYDSEPAKLYAHSHPESHQIGYSSNGTGKIIYKLYDFYGEYGRFTALPAEQIGKATLFINIEAAGGNSANLVANPMTDTWNATENGYDPIALRDDTLWNSYSEEHQSYTPVSSPINKRNIEIDITEIVRGWARFNLGASTSAYDNPENGFVLSSMDALSYHSIDSVEEVEYNSVMVVLDTSYTGGTYYINNYSLGDFLQFENFGVAATKYINSDSLKWTIQYLGDDLYYIRPQAFPNYALCEIGDAVKLDFLPTNIDYQFIWELQPAIGGGMIIQNKNSGRVLHLSNDGANEDAVVNAIALPSPSESDYTATAWAFLSCEYFVNLTDFSIRGNDWYAIGSSQYLNITKTPSDATWGGASGFLWISDDESVATVNAEGRLLCVGNGTARILVIHKPTGLSYFLHVTVGQAIPGGTYRFMNKKTYRYMDVEGPSKNDGAYIQQWNLHTGTQEQWRISYYGSGYYTVQSVYSGKYVSVYNSSASVNASIIQTTSITEGSKWKISKTESGAFKLIPKSGESHGYCLSLPATSGGNGLNCIQASYAKNTDYRDEWYMSDITRKLTVNVMMDGGYVARYSGVSNATFRITEHMNRAREKLAEYFFICLDYSTPTQFVSLADTCGSGIHSPCSHCGDENCKNALPNSNTSQYELHHKNLYNIMARLPHPTAESEAIIAFIGHETCMIDHNNEHKESGLLGITNEGARQICITNFEGLPSGSKTTLHELNHLFYAEDHYNFDGTMSTEEKILSTGDQRYSKNCIHGENKGKEDIMENLILCGGCRAKILEYFT